ncbi:Rap1a/Tai family immunity protein [Proteus sp. STS61-E]|uniref:Rap1a/Tai family immunity protein n=1 Tax=Proteus sp. STS61-E TaxID=3237301 RepID=UPI0034C64CA3
MKKIIFLILLTISPSAFSSAYTAGEIKRFAIASNKAYTKGELSNKELMDASIFQGYVAGIYDSGEGIYYCPPIDATLVTLNKGVIKYILNNRVPDSSSGMSLVVKSLMSAFPCGR